MTHHQLPGSRWFQWIRNLTVRVGVLTGVYLSLVMTVALLAANRLPLLEPVAEIRNWAARIAFALIMVVPVCTFFRNPARMIAAAGLGWGIFSLAYAGAGVIFDLLHQRFFSTFHLFILGMSLYGVMAVASWVATLIYDAAHQPALDTRRR